MKKKYKVIIVGSGFSGLLAAIKLQKSNINDFLILERDEDMGGTWRANTYPGAQVDVPSHLYSFSFEPYDWTRMFAYQHEILKYTEHIIDKYELRPKTQCNASVKQLFFDEADAIWNIETENGDTYQAKYVINASGGLSQPNIPELKNADKFKGKTMHTAQWDHDYDYKDKKVILIGSAASAIQVGPAIAPYVEHLTIFQRSAHWILPRPDRALTNIERKTFKNFPAVQKAYRESIFMKFEARVLAFQYVTSALKLFEKEGINHIKNSVDDPALVEKLKPNYTMGCKRILMSNDYYPTLNRDNVTLLTKESGIEEFYEKGIKTTDGKMVEAELVIYATGFHAAEDNVVYPVIGKNKITLDDEWSNYAHAYLGATVPNFPNFFIMAGPNTGTGHTSAIGFFEYQLEYVIRAINSVEKRNKNSIEIKPEVEAKYNKQLQADLKDSVWQTGGCHSWYKTKDGINTTMYPRFTHIFKRDCKNFKPSQHIYQ